MVWVSRMVLVAAVALAGEQKVVSPDRLEPHMTILDVRLEKSTLHEAQGVLGPAETRHNGGDAAASAYVECYVGNDGTTLAFISNSEMGGGTTITEYQLVERESLVDFAGTESGTDYVPPPQHRPQCAALKSLSRSTRTNGGLTLGLSPAEVRRLLGEPSATTATHFLFTSEAKVPMTPEQRKAFEAYNGPRQSQDFLMRGRGVRVEFDGGKVTAIRAWQVTST